MSKEAKKIYVCIKIAPGPNLREGLIASIEAAKDNDGSGVGALSHILNTFKEHGHNVEIRSWNTTGHNDHEVETAAACGTLKTILSSVLGVPSAEPIA